ncbi:MAG: threonine synthase [Bacilli bacterium]|nr:threonine synthase [Bacilli bacterium]
MYKSTRSKNENSEITSSKAIINGMASDGGLYVLENIPKIDIEELSYLNYQELAIRVMDLLLDDFTSEEIRKIVYQAYDDKFDITSIVNLVKTRDCYFLELYHGQTLAFKDMALSVLPLLLQEAKKKNSVKDRTIVLTATSGDTGSAALSGFSKQEDIDIIVFYPTSGISEIQEKQMLSFSGNHSKVIALDGNFDDAQRLVKTAFNDLRLKQFHLSSANSINIGRLIPQVVYYFYSYSKLLEEEAIEVGEKINFVVPTGNFGNILAAYIAKKMGLPVNKLICASNTNNVLTDFFRKGIYNRQREFIKTSSPSMDILISSNLERLLYYASGNNESLVSELMKYLIEKGNYQINEKIKKGLGDFYANFATEEETLMAINKEFQESNYLIDTHTAVAYSVYEKYVLETGDMTRTVITSTAHPFKFPKAVCQALKMDYNGKDDFTLIEELSKRSNIRIPRSILELKEIYSRTIWSQSEAYRNLEKLLGEIHEKN